MSENLKEFEEAFDDRIRMCQGFERVHVMSTVSNEAFKYGMKYPQQMPQVRAMLRRFAQVTFGITR